MATVKHYLYAFGAAFMLFCGVFLYRKGQEDERHEYERDALESMRKAKDVRDEIDNDPYFVDRAAQWVRKDDR